MRTGCSSSISGCGCCSLSASAFRSWREQTGPRLGIGPRRSRSALALAYIAANLSDHRAEPTPQSGSVRIRTRRGYLRLAAAALFWRRDLVWREGDCYRRSSYSTGRSGLGPVSDCQPTNMSDPLVREAIRRDPRLRKFLKWSILPQADVVARPLQRRMSRSATRATARGGGSRLARETVMPTGAPGCARTSTTAVRIHNCAVMSTRGAHLVQGDRGFATGGGLLARLFAPGIRHRRSTGSTSGSKAAGSTRRLPDGVTAPARLPRAGSRCAASSINSWMALVRLATSGSVGWYKAWALGEWSIARSGADLRAVQRQCRCAGRARPRQGSVPLGQCARPSAARQCAAARRAPTSPRTTTSATISIRPGSTRR